MHSDFRLVEQGAADDDERLIMARRLLRTAWDLPSDTYVTADFPLLLTVLAQPPRTISGDRVGATRATLAKEPKGSR